MAGFWSNLFKPDTPTATSARVAADRLKVIVATENRLGRRLSQDSIERMKREIMEVVRRYVNGVDDQDVHMSVRREDSVEMLEMNINLPDDGELPHSRALWVGRFDFLCDLSGVYLHYGVVTTCNL